MRKERILAVIMSVLMALSMLPITVFAAETTALDGKIKIHGIAAEGKTLSADFKEVNTEGMTEDDVTYLWSRKTFDDEAAENAGETPQLKELGKEKTYTVTKDDIGSKIVLTITGKEENGYSGTLTVTSDEVVDAETGAALEAAAGAQGENTSEESGEDQNADTGNAEEQQPDNAEVSEDAASGTETVDGIPPATSDDQQPAQDQVAEEQPQEEQPAQVEESQDVPTEDELVKDDQMEDDQPAQADGSAEEEDKAGTETVDGIPPATSDDTYPADDGNNGTTEEPSNEEPSNENPSNEDPSDGTQADENPTPVTADKISVEGETQPTFSFVADYYTADDAVAAQKTITFTNNSDTAVALSIAASSDENQAATAAWAEQTDAQQENQTDTKTLEPQASAALTITPVTGLGVNSYQQTFTISNVNDPANPIEIKKITATVNIQKPTNDLTPNTDKTLDFATAKKGYSAVDVQTITYTNNGNVTETVTMPVSQSGNYEITTEDSLTLAPNGEGKITFSVRPKAGLAAGSYSETIKVATESGFEATPISVAFQVIKDTATLTKIQQPSAVSGLPNGTKKSASSLNLPSAVVIETTAGNMKAAVSWNVKGASYRQSATDEQNFTVSGTVTLPDGVDNDNNLNLATSIDVSVKAYSPKIASAEKNTITGIDYNGVYTTQSKISFTAVGDGMDNTSPRKGDTRYVPKSWTVLNNTLGWDAAPYTATFGLAKSGDYTLKVNFEQQKYDGNSWQPTNTTDTRQVSFSITKANVTAPGADLTPAISKTGAVKTGDNTPILPFVCLLIIAVGAAGGAVFYKKKNKNK